MAARFRLVVLCVVAFSLSGVAAFDPSNAEGQNAANLQQSINKIKPDAPLRGASVLRRNPPDDLPSMERSWVRVFNGTRKGPGVCSYSAEFLSPLMRRHRKSSQ